MDKKTFNEKDFEYTIVMDASYVSPDANDYRQAEESVKDPHEAEERLYSEYEKMILRDPTVLDKDDAYPHSYQWRVGDRYDKGKLAALEEAVSRRTRVSDTEAYSKYVEDMKNRKFKPESWD